MKQPSFSIIVPVYGVEKYIERCARSLFSQTYDSIQFVFVNDGTPDRSIEILNELIDSEFVHLRPKIVIVDKENEGLPAARKTGLEYATGDYILNVDSDDYIEYGSVELLSETIRNTAADFVSFGLQKEYTDRISCKSDKGVKWKKDYRMKIMSGKALPSLCAKCVSRSLYDNDIFFPEYPYAEDLTVSTQLSYYAGNIVFLDKILYHYDRSNPVAVTTRRKVECHSQACENLLGLYRHFCGRTSGTPLEAIAPSMMFRVAWYTLIHKLDFFERCPELPAYLRTAPLGKNYYNSVAVQLFLKFYIKCFLTYDRRKIAK